MANRSKARPVLFCPDQMYGRSKMSDRPSAPRKGEKSSQLVSPDTSSAASGPDRLPIRSSTPVDVALDVAPRVVRRRGPFPIAASRNCSRLVHATENWVADTDKYGRPENIVIPKERWHWSMQHLGPYIFV